MKISLPLVLCCLLLAACRVDLGHLPPIESCFIMSASPAGDAPDKTELSPTQLEPLSAWLAALGDQWEFKVTDHYPSGLVFILKHKGGRVTRANLRGDQLWTGNFFKVLTPAQRQELMAIVAAKHQLPAFGR